MTPSIKQEFIQDFGEAYHRNGLPTLMGRIVGLLLFVNKPITLDEITKQLNVSKGPVSQVMRRLRDHHLIQRIWIPGDRKDYYKAESDIFGNAFRNQVTLMEQNLALVRNYQSALSSLTDPDLESFTARMDEMDQFYKLMKEHFIRFQKEWIERKKTIATV